MSKLSSNYMIALVAVSSLWAACGKGGKGDQAKQAKAAAEPMLQIAAEDVVKVTQGEIQTGPRISGTLEASQRAVIRAESNGAVVAFDARDFRAYLRLEEIGDGDCREDRDDGHDDEQLDKREGALKG